MKEEMISIIVPVYQVARYIGKCVDSILAQSYSNIEVLLIDDASTDGSADICDAYQKLDQRIKVFHFSVNKGLSAARNEGIKKAKGKYLAFVDSDDWIHPDYLFLLYKVLIDSGCRMSQCGSELAFDGTNTELCRVFCEEAQVYEYKAYFNFLYLIIERDSVIVCNKLFDAGLFQNIRFPEGKIHEDEFVTYRLICEAKSVAVIYSKLYYYRRRQDSITGAFSPNRMDAHYAFCERENFFRERKEEDLLRLTEGIHYRWISDIVSQFRENNYIELAEILEKYQKMLASNYYENGKREEIEKEAMYLFPFSKIPSGSRVILYGAGKVGVQFFRQIIKSSYCQLMGWLDKDAAVLKEKGYPVREICELRKLEGKWDYMVIAIANERITFEVTERLKREFAVPNDKIVRFMEEIDYDKAMV